MLRKTEFLETIYFFDVFIRREIEPKFSMHEACYDEHGNQPVDDNQDVLTIFDLDKRRDVKYILRWDDRPSESEVRRVIKEAEDMFESAQEDFDSYYNEPFEEAKREYEFQKLTKLGVFGRQWDEEEC